MPAFKSFMASVVPQVHTAILAPVSRTYGSLELSKLAQLGRDLADFAVQCPSTAVILDLSGVAQHGSGFLNELIDFANALRQRDVDFIIAGDQTGLVQLVGGPAWCHITGDLVEALNHCGRQVVAA